MSTKLLTSTQLKALTETDSGKILNDGGGLRGRVRINRQGNLSVQFEYRYRAGKKSKTTKVDQWPTLSLAQIRTKCNQIKSELSQGIDPIERRKNQKLTNKLDQAQEIERQKAELQRLAIEAANNRTFGDAVQQWFSRELSRRKDSGHETIRSFKKDVLPKLGAVALTDVTKAMILEVLDEIVARGAKVMANHIFGDLRQFYNYAVAREWVPAHPLAGLTKERIGGKQNERDRFLNEAEITELYEKLPDAKLPKATEHAIWIMLATACRVGELSQANWSQVDLAKGEWIIPAGNSKNAKEHTIFLSPFASQHFEALLGLSQGSEWCLPSRDISKHIGLKSISKQIRDRTRATQIANRSSATESLLLSGGNWTPHDLRRTAATLMGELGVMGEVIERCLNHVEPNRLKRIYQRHELRSEKRHAWLMLGDRLSLLKTTKKENIIVGNFIVNS